MKAEVLFSMGRSWLVIADCYVAMEGDPCREPNVIRDTQPAYENEGRDGMRCIWTLERLRKAVALINGKKK